MSTKIFDKFGVLIQRFYGGADRGRCYAILLLGRKMAEPLELTDEQFQELVDVLRREASV